VRAWGAHKDPETVTRETGMPQIKGRPKRPAELFRRIGGTLSLSHQIEKYVEESIRSKRLLSGQKLPTELELCKMFGVSRTPLREALRNLRSKGLIQVKMGSGMYVGELTTEEALSSLKLYFELNMDPELVLQIVQARRVFEPAIAETAAGSRTEEDLRALKQSIEDFRNCDPADLQRSGEIDHHFHFLLANAVRNPVVPLLMKPIYDLPTDARNLVYGKVNPGTKEIALDYHTRIFEAIRSGDGAAARSIMTAHLDFTDKNVRHTLSSAQNAATP
jgi:GntR family transcriptional regulator, transcriptional repressor for pyruvate dehydrogenase complex